MRSVIIGAVEVDSGDVSYHVRGGVAGYDTLCGLSLNDDCFESVEPGRGQRIDCAECRTLWQIATRARLSDFAR